MATKKSIFYSFGVSLLTLIQACSSTETHENKFIQWEQAKTPQSGFTWTAGQALPQFSAVSDTVDAIHVDRPPMKTSEVLMLTTLQGNINRTKPRIMLLNTKRGGKSEWADRLGINTVVHPIEDKWEFVKKYSNEIKGIVLYDPSKSVHYNNLVSTIASLENCIAATKAEKDSLLKIGVDLPVIKDICNLQYTKPSEIYKHMYMSYWKDCTKRMILSLSPNVVCDIRDMAVATNAASVWLDPRIEEEKRVLDMFLSDMKAGESIILGWWPEERSGIGIGTSHGISTIPSDFYDNSTIFSAAPHIIFNAPVPKRSALENKIYLCLFLSDGDNAQYCQHSMLKLWENEKRGSVPLNWTVSPGLVDLGPEILNHYNRTATANDCFSAGPSGLGYALIYDAHNKIWFAPDRNTIEPYIRFTQQYLEKSGLRCITIWDEINNDQVQAYADNCRFLYGMTQQDWRKGKKVIPMTKNRRLAVLPNIPCYENNINSIYNHWKDTIATFSGKSPIFLTAQGISWKLGPDEILKLKDTLEVLAPGKIEFCRGDHFFSLYNEANGLEYNITMSEDTKISSSSKIYDEFISDGSSSPEHQWIDADKDKENWIEFDFSKECCISRYVVRHAGIAGGKKNHNTRKFALYVSNDQKNWLLVDRQKNNRFDVSDIDIPTVNARYARIVIEDTGTANKVIIGDVEIFGKPLN